MKHKHLSEKDEILNNIGLIYVIAKDVSKYIKKFDDRFFEIGNTDTFSTDLYNQKIDECRKFAKELEVGRLEITYKNEESYDFTLTFDQQLLEEQFKQECNERKEIAISDLKKLFDVDDITEINGDKVDIDGHEIKKYLDAFADLCVKFEGHGADHIIQVAALGATYLEKIKENPEPFRKNIENRFEDKRKNYYTGDVGAKNLALGALEVIAKKTPTKGIEYAGILHDIGRLKVPVEKTNNFNNGLLSHAVEGCKMWDGGLKKYYNESNIIKEEDIIMEIWENKIDMVRDGILYHPIMPPFLFYSCKSPSTMLLRECDRLPRIVTSVEDALGFASKTTPIKKISKQIQSLSDGNKMRTNNYLKYAFVTFNEAEKLNTAKVIEYKLYIKNSFALNRDFREVANKLKISI